MYGGDIGRTNRSDAAVAPPLMRVWETDAGAGFGPSSPAVADGRVFVANLQGEIQVLDVATGNTRGTFDFGSAIAGTPALENGLIYFGLAHDENSVVCYEVQNAEVRWQAKAGGVEAAPLLMGKTLYVATLEGRLVALNTFDGTERWVFAVPAGNGLPGIHSAPASDSTNLYFGCDDGNVYAVSADRGRMLWSAGTGGAVVASPAVTGGSVYVGSLDGAFYAFRAADGSLLWRRDLGAKLFGAQAVDDTAVYVGTTGRAVVALDRRTGAVRWQTPVGGIVNAAPLVSGPVVYVGAADRLLYALEAASGTVLWTDTLSGRVKTTPAAWGPYLIVLAEDRAVVTYREGRSP